MQKAKNIKGILIALCAFFLFTCGDALLKHTSEYYSPVFSGMIIAGIQFIALLFISRYMGGLKQLFQSPNKKLLAARGLAGAMCWVFFIIGLLYVPIANAYAIHLSSAFWTILIAIIFLNHHVGLHRWISIVAGFIGVLIVLRPGTDGFELPALFFIGSALCFSVVALVSRAIGEEEPLFNLVFTVILFDFSTTTLSSLATGAFEPVQLEHLPFLLGSAACYLSGLFCMSRAFSMAESVVVTPTNYSQILWGAIIGIIFFAETPSLWTITGAVLIVCSGIYLIYREHMDPEEPHVL